MAAQRSPKLEQAYRERLEQWSRLPLAWLEPGEYLHGVADVGLDRFVRRELPKRLRVEKPPLPAGAKAPAVRKRGCLMTVLLFPLVLLDLEGVVEDTAEATFKGIRRMFHGRPFVGGWRSLAGRFVVAVRTGPTAHRRYRHTRALLAFTDRGLLLVDHDHGELLGRFHRAELGGTGIVRSRQPKRVDLRFADGSLVAVVADSPEAAQVLRALTQR
ncbi:hypothetical protein OG871_32585 [Kitasatospora sp. NBC_00374]|uniref:hypothetical protein n=1 Tax=Kitasatospora sp. NBC_00374 TaxID=2975964 RepID=UPI0030E1D0C9